MSDDQEHKSVMIALLPSNSEWTEVKLPHLTLVYAGEVDSLKKTDFNELAKDASMLSALSRPVGLRVVSKEQFGRGTELVEALRLQPSPELWSMRRAVERWNASEYPFNPHVTIGPPGTQVQDVPRYIHFNRMLLAWGGDHLYFTLRS